MAAAKPTKCPFCGARSKRGLTDVWTCGTITVLYGDDDELLEEPKYDVGDQCNATVYRTAFLRCHDLLVKLNGYLTNNQSIPAEVMAELANEVSEEKENENADNKTSVG